MAQKQQEPRIILTFDMPVSEATSLLRWVSDNRVNQVRIPNRKQKPGAKPVSLMEIFSRALHSAHDCCLEAEKRGLDRLERALLIALRRKVCQGGSTLRHMRMDILNPEMVEDVVSEWLAATAYQFGLLKPGLLQPGMLYYSLLGYDEIPVDTKDDLDDPDDLPEEAPPAMPPKDQWSKAVAFYRNYGIELEACNNPDALWHMVFMDGEAYHHTQFAELAMAMLEVMARNDG